MAWMEHGLLKTYALSMEDKMAARAFGHARDYGRDSLFNRNEAVEGRGWQVCGKGDCKNSSLSALGTSFNNEDNVLRQALWP